MTRKIKRAIEAIADDLAAALKREASDVVAIGGLLIEAQDQLDHGQWLPWLETNFGSSIRTADNYMNAARLTAKLESVSNLKLRPTALYLLGSKLDGQDPLFSPEAIKAILKVAASEWVNADRAREIAKSLLPLPPPPGTVEEVEAEVARSEIDAVLDGPPPELPPAPIAEVHDVILPPFDSAVATLAQLQTKPLASFIGTAHAPDRIAGVVAFLEAVIDAMAKRVAA